MTFPALLPIIADCDTSSRSILPPGSSLVTEPPICRIKTHYLFLPPPPPPRSPPQTPDAVAVIAVAVTAAVQKSSFLFFGVSSKIESAAKPNPIEPPADQRSRSEEGRLGGPCNYTSFLTPRPRPPSSAAQGDVAQFLPDPWPNQRIISSARAGRGTSASIFHRVPKTRVLIGVALQAKFTLEMYCSPHIVTGTNWPTSCRDEIFVTSTIGDLPSFLPACPANAFLCLLCPRVTQLAREEGAREG